MLILISVFVGLCACASHAGISMSVLSSDDGRGMVRNEYVDCAFETGSFGNDVSMILPFCWTVPNAGVYTYFTAAEHRQTDGISWSLRRVEDGKLIPLSHPWTPETDVWFCPVQLFEVTSRDGQRGLFYHQERTRRVTRKDVDESVCLVDSTWYNLAVATNAIPKKTAINGGCRALFRLLGAVSIRNVMPHRYRGADALPVLEPSDSQKRLLSGERQPWKMPEESKKRLAALHREHLAKIRPGVQVSKVYLVVGDGDFEGTCDAYVTSDAEAKDGRNYMWTLYVASGGQFVRSNRNVSQTFNRIETVFIDAEVCAPRDSFFRWDRIGMPSYIMPLTFVDGEVELWDYANHESCVKSFRRQTGFGNTGYGDCIGPSACGVAGLEDLFVGGTLVRAECLPCETIEVSSR